MLKRCFHDSVIFDTALGLQCEYMPWQTLLAQFQNPAAIFLPKCCRRWCPPTSAQTCSMSEPRYWFSIPIHPLGCLASCCIVACVVGFHNEDFFFDVLHCSMAQIDGEIYDSWYQSQSQSHTAGSRVCTVSRYWSLILSFTFKNATEFLLPFQWNHINATEVAFTWVGQSPCWSMPPHGPTSQVPLCNAGNALRKLPQH